MEIPSHIAHQIHEINLNLEKYIDRYCEPQIRLGKAIKYSTLMGGKRVRPLLALATAESFGAQAGIAMPYACAIECVHAYSLVHDDLPAMDDDDLRRGQKTCHIEFDEATAILAGDALQALAFQIASDKHLDQSTINNRLAIIQTLAEASGPMGMVGGQSIDLNSVGLKPSIEKLKKMHQLKTGALIEASVRIGALCSNKATQQELSILSEYAQAIGLGFQVQDDILDVISDTQTLGKTQGADKALNKPTYPSLIGLEASQKYLKELHEQALSSLDKLPHLKTETLAQIADFIVARTR